MGLKGEETLVDLFSFQFYLNHLHSSFISYYNPLRHIKTKN